MDANTTRQEREREFHDALYAEGGRESAARFYTIFSQTEARFREQVQERAKGGRVLEIGCGLAALAFDLSPVAEAVLGIDISPVAVDRSRQRAQGLGLTNTRFETMDAERLEVPDGSVDLVFATGVLHHLDIERAGAELARVLSPRGSALFLEPMGHNPVINAYRDRTPQMRTPDEHPLLRSDFVLLSRWFERVDTRFQHLSTLAAVPLRSRRSHARVVAALHKVDDALFRLVPPLRHHAWYVELDLSGPRPRAGG